MAHTFAKFLVHYVFSGRALMSPSPTIMPSLTVQAGGDLLPGFRLPLEKIFPAEE